MATFRTLQDILLAARRNLPSPMWDFITYGTESETTVMRNRQAFDRLALRPEVMRDVRDIDVTASLLGETLRIPVVLSPVGALGRINADGVAGAAKAVAEFGTMQIVSGVIADFEAIPRQSGASLIYAVQGDIELKFPGDIARRAQDAGYKALAFVTEAPYFSRRERDVHHNLVSGRKSPSSYAAYLRDRRLSPPDPDTDAALVFDWKLLDAFKSACDLPLVVKGITTAADARRAMDCGADVVYVSNHGGRALDHALGAASVLPEVVEAVAGRAAVLMDGGVARGTDILKALALGADAVCVGKLQAFAFAAAGRAGVLRMLEILEEELIVSAGLLGVSKLDQLSSRHVAAAEAVYPPHPLNPFPLVMEELARR